MILVKDNVIGDKYSQYLFDQMCKLDWKFVPDISLGNTKDNHPGFSSTLFLDAEFNNVKKETIHNPMYNLFAPVILEASDQFGKKFHLDHVFRSRARLTLNEAKTRIGNPHIDYATRHWVLIYYVNSTDGDTLLFDEKGKIIEKITPRRGRCVLFDGDIKHAASNSTAAPRIIINNNIRI